MVSSRPEVLRVTERLYYFDGHLSRFEARVLSCEAEKDGYAVKLDRTAFSRAAAARRRTRASSRGKNSSPCARRARISYTLLKSPLSQARL